jgi:hypothetical protein
MLIPQAVIQSVGSGRVLVQTITVPSGGATTVDFDSIPQTYQHLEILAQAQTENASPQNLQVQYNGDTGSNYYTEYFLAAGNTTAVNKQEAATSGIAAIIPETGAAQPATIKMTLPFYTRTARTTLLSESGGYWSSEGRLSYTGVLWTSAVPITRISFTSSGGSDLKESSIFSLYGLD